MAKLDIDFILLDESVVMNGFRALMSGAKLEGFLKNPVMLIMHIRGNDGILQANENSVLLPIGKWYDIRIIDGKLLAKPDFDDADEFALKVQGKVSNGYLNGASVWIDPIACSDDTALALTGQRGPTIVEWGILEASIVDIPNCRNSLAIRNSAGTKIALSGDHPDAGVLDYLRTLTNSSQKNFMDKKLLCANLGLPEDATDAQISAKLAALKENAGTATEMQTKLSVLQTENTTLKEAAIGAKLTALIDGAVEAKKILPGDKDKYLKLAKADFDTTKELIDGMQPYESIESQLSTNGAGDKLALSELLKLSGEQLYMAGKLEQLKALDLPQFKLKYKEAFGVEFKG